MFKKILIANRGEIAVRIIRACQEMGIATVAVVSEVDRDSLHAYLADEVVCIGGNASADSYLNVQNIVSAAVNKGAEAIHPGFGFLSENADFAEICQRCGIKFIGPDKESIILLGDKAIAKQTMMDNKVPTIPGTDGEITDIAEAKAIAKEIGFPILLKASAGGGGRGIRLVNSEEELEEAFHAASTEALSYFGNGGVYMEKFLTETRHIEFQILADEHGNVVHLGERDCSMQRRHQKVVEETPCAVLSEELRTQMGQAAVNAAKAVGYKNTGTVEFLLDQNNNFYFMEMNTRIQVEHPVTEMVTRLDLIKKQIEIAAGMPLGLTQKDVTFEGHSIECRINAESVKNNFMPTGGTIEALHVPGGLGIRFDSHMYQGYKLPMYYDSMIGKLIVWAPTRKEAIMRMKRALDEIKIEGFDTNISFQSDLIGSEAFVTGNYNTATIEGMLTK